MDGVGRAHLPGRQRRRPAPPLNGANGDLRGRGSLQALLRDGEVDVADAEEALPERRHFTRPATTPNSSGEEAKGRWELVEPAAARHLVGLVGCRLVCSSARPDAEAIPSLSTCHRGAGLFCPFPYPNVGVLLEAHHHRLIAHGRGVSPGIIA